MHNESGDYLYQQQQQYPCGKASEFRQSALLAQRQFKQKRLACLLFLSRWLRPGARVLPACRGAFLTFPLPMTAETPRPAQTRDEASTSMPRVQEGKHGRPRVKKFQIA